MRELSEEEIQEVSGAIGLPGIVLGAGLGAFTAITNKGSIDQVLLAALFGGAAGAAGNLAGSAAAGGFVVRTAWGIRSGGLSYVSGAIATNGAQQSLNMPSNGGDLLRMGSQERY
ncbi:MAG: hypothetical protein P8R02_00165 [Pseudomonadales bacterium]|jgi:hypothetical protein|nr:hypothetical protein [Pseudomonadales bacterium]